MSRGSSGPIAVSPLQLTVRCIAERKGDQWQAFTIEFGLAAQADSFQGVKHKIEDMIASYLEDALGQDRKHAYILLNRKSTLSVRWKYYLFALLMRFGRVDHDRNGSVFNETLPLTTGACLAS